MDDKLFFLERMSFERIVALAVRLGYPITDKRWGVKAIADHLARKRKVTRDIAFDALDDVEMASAARALGVDPTGGPSASRVRVRAAIEGTTVKAARRAALASMPTEIVAIPAKLLDVVDGDTIRVEAEGEHHWVRIRGIDAPESSPSDKLEKDLDHALIASEQMTAMGRAATDWLGRCLAGHDLYLHVQRTPLGPQQYLHHNQHRLLAYVTLDTPDGVDVGASMLAAGYALVWPRNLKTRRYAHPRDATYVVACHGSLVGKPGLWGRELGTMCPSRENPDGWSLAACRGTCLATAPDSE